MNGHTFVGRETATALQALTVAKTDHPELDEDDIAIVVGAESDLEEAIAAAVRKVLELEAVAEGALALSRVYKRRAEAKQAAVDRGRASIRDALEAVGLRKMVLAEATISVGRGQPGVLLTDEQAVPMAYRKAEPRIDAAYQQLLRAAAYAQAHGNPEMHADFLHTARDLAALFVIDRKSIAEALKRGETVPGCQLSNGSSWLVVRR